MPVTQFRVLFPMLFTSQYRLPWLRSFGFGLFLSLPHVLQAQPLPIITAAIDRDIQRYLTKNLIPGGAVAIVTAAGTQWRRTFGRRHHGALAPPITPYTCFRIASLSKAISAALAIKLAEQGQLSLTKPLAHYLPHYRVGDSQVLSQANLIHLLSHSAGLTPYALEHMAYLKQPATCLWQHLRYVAAPNTPGSVYHYQNVFFSLLSPIIQACTHKPYSQILRQQLLDPLRMHNVCLSSKDWTQCPRTALPHILTSKGFVRHHGRSCYDNILPAGGIAASILDMEKWLQALLGGRPDVLSASVLQQLYQKRIIVQPQNWRHKPPWYLHRVQAAHYALGWRVLDYKGKHLLIYHGGTLAGYRTAIALLPSRGMAIVVLTNSNSYFPEQLLNIFVDTSLAFTPLLASCSKRMKTSKAV